MISNTPPFKLPSDLPPQLIVVIDTEEEFDWSAKADRNKTAVTAMQHIDRIQNIFDEYGIIPCYAIDYPVASQPEGIEPLLQIYKDNRCEIGAHLHPWVSPPHEEVVSSYNTYAGNLPRDLELAKLQELRNQIESSFGNRPTTYKAGRYGIGPNTESILEELGFDVDLSFCPPVDYRADGGPDFSDSLAEPFWFGTNNNMLEIPVTGAFVGWAGSASKRIYNASNHLKSVKMPGILAKLSVVDRLMLSPEGFDTADHIKLTKFLFNQGVRTFTWSLHSTSVEPGMAPYVRSKADLEKFLDKFRRFFDFFFSDYNGVATTPTLLKKRLEKLK